MAKRKTGLGKGLDAILPADLVDELEKNKSRRLENLPIQSIKSNPMQPREEFNPTSLNELAESIKAQGVLQPVLVTRDSEGVYILIAGERRWRASKIAGLDEIPAIIINRKLSQQELLFIALVENLQRENLDPIEEAEAYQSLSHRFELTQEEISERVGKSRSAVANTIRLLRLPKPIISMLKEKKITAGHARVLLEEKDESRQLRLAKLASDRGLSVERLGIIVLSKDKLKKRAKGFKDPDTEALEDEISMLLGTRVEIIRKKRGGKLVIEFLSDEELFDYVKKLTVK
jgi:ParB family chromosome partitioning protein